MPRKARDLPDRHILNEIFDYDPSTGYLYRKLKNGTIRQVGTLVNNGYLMAVAQKQLYLVHRIIWTMVYGPIPDGLYVDHINGDPLDNRIGNMRLCEHQQNCVNKRLNKSNTTGYRGVSWVAKRGCYWARIKHDGEEVFLGSYATAEEANDVYRAVSEFLYGDFASHISRGE